MIRAVSGFLGGARQTQQLVSTPPQRGSELVRAELQDASLCVGAQAALLGGERTPVVRKLCGGGLLLCHGAERRGRCQPAPDDAGGTSVIPSNPPQGLPSGSYPVNFSRSKCSSHRV